MRKFFICTGLSVLSVLISHPAWAAPSWLLSPSFQVQEQYTDNLFATDNNREEDWITLISAGLALQAQARTWELNLNYRPSYSFYQEYSEYDSLRHNAGLDFSKDFSKHLHFTLGDSFSRSEQPYDPARDVQPPDREDRPQQEADYTLRQGREPRSTNTARAGLDYQFGPRDRVYANYSLRHFWSDNPTEEDSVRSSPTLGLEYWFTSHFGFKADAGYTHGSFDDSEDFNSYDGSLKLIRNFSRFLDGYIQYSHSRMNYSDERADYDVYEPSAGFSYRFSKDGSFSLGLGYNIRDEDNNDRDEELVLNADINQTWDLKRGSFRLRASSGYTETYFGAENLGYTIYYQAGAYYQYGLSKHLNWNTSADYRYNDYKDQEPERQDQIVSLGTGLSQQLTRRVFLNLNYDYRLRDSDLDREDYYENQVSLSLSWQPRGLRF